MEDMTLIVSGMACDDCRQRVQEALESVAGVERVEVTMDVNLGHGHARVRTLEGTSDEDLTAAVEDAGYAVERTQRTPGQSR